MKSRFVTTRSPLSFLVLFHLAKLVRKERAIMTSQFVTTRSLLIFIATFQLAMLVRNERIIIWD
eukprot:3457951-Alexandrium_andersonii.AAC.1